MSLYYLAEWYGPPSRIVTHLLHLVLLFSILNSTTSSESLKQRMKWLLCNKSAAIQFNVTQLHTSFFQLTYQLSNWNMLSGLYYVKVNHCILRQPFTVIGSLINESETLHVDNTWWCTYTRTQARDDVPLISWTNSSQLEWQMR